MSLKKEEAIKLFCNFLEGKENIKNKIKKRKEYFWKNLKKDIKENNYIKEITKKKIDSISLTLKEELRNEITYSFREKRIKIRKGFIRKIGDYKRYEVDYDICAEEEIYLVFYNPANNKITFLLLLHDLCNKENFLSFCPLKKMAPPFEKQINLWVLAIFLKER